MVLQLEKRLEVLKLRLRLPFRSPAAAGSLHSQRSLRAPCGSTFFKLNGYNIKVMSALAVPFTCWRRLTTLTAQIKRSAPIQLFQS